MDWENTYADYVKKDGVKSIQALEKETGKLILAYPTPPVAADLTPEQMKKIRKLEKKLCVRLVAYESH
ncbi:MAG: hypothetical protein QNI92_16555 [Desulfobacterales bacterium]|nr:hypothetical protein [Desulfobacterales bacterium]MDJ0913841.1 hypothetical protein [Desulfobacterales bacterium]